MKFKTRQTTCLFSKSREAREVLAQMLEFAQ